MSKLSSPLHDELVAGLVAMAPGGSPARSPDGRASLASLTGAAREHLLDEVLPFWEPRVIDPRYAGLFHYYDREGNLTGEDKSTWCQGRMAYTFSLLLLELGRGQEPARRDRWYGAAAAARRFVVDHAHAGGGRWHYLCDRTGRVKDDRRSAFSDVFALMGLCAWSLASGDRSDLPLVRDALAILSTNLQDPSFTEYHHFQLDPAYRWHGPAMVALGLVPLARATVGDEAVRSLADWALDRILWNCANDRCQMLLEMTDQRGGLVDTLRGRMTNPGHALESMWFCLEEAIYRRDRRLVDRALEVTRWAVVKGWDPEYGGLFAFVSPEGGPLPNDLVPANDRWDDKLWWVQAEAMYTLALAAVLSEDPFFLRYYERLQAWAFTHLHDRRYGEWFLSADRAGRPEKTTKGNVFRSAFHVPRALLKLARLGDGLASIASGQTEEVAGFAGRRTST